MRTGLKLLAAIVVAGLAGTAVYGLLRWRPNEAPEFVPVSGNIECTDVEISFKIPGRVVQRLVDEGQWVRKGDVVAILETDELEAEVNLREAELEAALSAQRELEASFPLEVAAADAARRKALAAWQDLQQGFRPQEKEAAQAEVDAAQKEVDRLERDFARAQALRQQNAISVQQYDTIATMFEVAKERLRQARQRQLLTDEGFRQYQIAQAHAAWEQAEAEYSRVVGGPREEKNRQAAARVQEAQAALSLARTRLGYARAVSPITGMVLSKNVEPGEYVSPGTPVVTVGDLVNVWLRAYIQESDLGRVKLGQLVHVTTDTYPGKVYQGRVSLIASEAEFTPKNIQTQAERVKLVYRIKIDIPNPKMELKPGMPADAKILVNSPPAGAPSP